MASRSEVALPMASAFRSGGEGKRADAARLHGTRTFDCPLGVSVNIAPGRGGGQYTCEQRDEWPQRQNRERLVKRACIHFHTNEGDIVVVTYVMS